MLFISSLVSSRIALEMIGDDKRGSGARMETRQWLSRRQSGHTILTVMVIMVSSRTIMAGINDSLLLM